jgi:dTMP kinase
MKGLFITFEGIEGSGKSTISRKAADYLTSQGHTVIHTHEPGDTMIGKEIRRVLLAPSNVGMHPLTELLLYFADRAEHTRKLISPALDRGEIVICDRFSDSTIAYQGYGRGIEIGILKEIDRFSRGGISPSLTILLDLDVRIGLERNRQASKLDRFELEDVEFHERVREGYLKIAEEEPERVRIIDSSRGIEAVFEDLRKVLDEKIF